jgi:hypothetical protein
MDSVQSYELFCCFFLLHLSPPPFNFIYSNEVWAVWWRWGRAWKDIAPCGERLFFCISAKTFSKTETKTSLETFLIFYCFVGNKIFRMYQRKFLVIKKRTERRANEITSISFIFVAAFFLIIFALRSFKSNPIYWRSLQNLFEANESSENTLIPIISLQIRRSEVNRKKIFARSVENTFREWNRVKETGIWSA